MGISIHFTYLEFHEISFFLLQFKATKSSLSENEKREKRAMERKISEMEEELKVKLVPLLCSLIWISFRTNHERKFFSYEKLTQNPAGNYRSGKQTVHENKVHDDFSLSPRKKKNSIQDIERKTLWS